MTLLRIHSVEEIIAHGRTCHTPWSHSWWHSHRRRHRRLRRHHHSSSSSSTTHHRSSHGGLPHCGRTHLIHGRRYHFLRSSSQKIVQIYVDTAIGPNSFVHSRIGHGSLKKKNLRNVRSSEKVETYLEIAHC